MACLVRFFSGRPLIDDKLAPKFFYQDDNLRGDKISLAEVIDQEPLAGSLSTQLDLELRHVVDVCNILKLAETTRDFLRVTGGERNESLLKRMKKLRLAPTADVTQHLNQVRLCYRVNYHHMDLGWADFDLDVPPILTSCSAHSDSAKI